MPETKQVLPLNASYSFSECASMFHQDLAASRSFATFYRASAASCIATGTALTSLQVPNSLLVSQMNCSVMHSCKMPEAQLCCGMPDAVVLVVAMDPGAQLA